MEDNLKEELTDEQEIQEQTEVVENQESTIDEEQADTEKADEPKDDLAELKDKYLRLLAEFENFKKRTIREKLDLMSNAAQETMRILLPVLDDFDRAKKHADDEKNEEQFSDGVRLVYDKLHSTLKNKGLKPMESNGEKFDAELHEAITEIPAPTDDMKGKIVDTIDKGYYLNDKIIRHAKVVVGR